MTERAYRFTQRRWATTMVRADIKKKKLNRRSLSPSSAAASLRLSPCLSCNPRAPLVCGVCCCHGKVRKWVKGSALWEVAVSVQVSHGRQRALSLDVRLRNAPATSTHTLWTFPAHVGPALAFRSSGAAAVKLNHHKGIQWLSLYIWNVTVQQIRWFCAH